MTTKKFITALLTIGALSGGVDAAEVKQDSYYAKKEYKNLTGMKGFSDKALETHFTLYNGYVTNTNKILSELAALRDSKQTATPQYSELARRYGWEFNGMRLHELYFENLGGSGELDTTSPLHQDLARDFGSFEAWQDDFKAHGKMRGIGWVVLYKDLKTGLYTNTWINEHDVGHLSGASPVLVMDVFEHAYFIDYTLDRASYIDAFFGNIDWKAVAARVGG